MRRRDFLALSPFVVGCDMPKDPNAVPFGMPPWHMWGGTTQLNVTSTPSLGAVTSRQICRISYKRPETWSFFFGARVLSATGASPLRIFVVFDLIIGIGRTMFDTTATGGAIGNVPAFARFVFDTTIPIVPVLNQPKYTTTGRGPVHDDSTPLVLAPPIEWIAAQDIQCSARAILGAVGNAVVETTAWFAPRTHVRPDWFLEKPADQFKGGEHGGT